MVNECAHVLVATTHKKFAGPREGASRFAAIEVDCLGSCGRIFSRQGPEGRFVASDGTVLGPVTPPSRYLKSCGHDPLIETELIRETLGEDMVIYGAAFSCFGTCGRVFRRESPGEGFADGGVKLRRLTHRPVSSASRLRLATLD